ncbi:MAG: hypothetical protein ACI9YO_002445 [Gammaproteobacteria bacterium]|jgi:hypothetical protein
MAGLTKDQLFFLNLNYIKLTGQEKYRARQGFIE